MFLKLLHWLRVDSAGSASAEPAEPDPPQVDADALLQSVGHDRVLLHSIVDAYRQTWAEQLDAVRSAVAADDPAALFHAAHQVRGCLLTLCAGPAVARAEALEASGRSGRARGLEAQVEDLARCMETVERELSALSEEAA